jgi:hypothetical protein
MMPPPRWASNMVAKPYQLYFLGQRSSDVSFNIKLNYELKLSDLSLPFFLCCAIKCYSLFSVYNIKFVDKLINQWSWEFIFINHLQCTPYVFHIFVPRDYYMVLCKHICIYICLREKIRVICVIGVIMCTYG